MKPFRHTLAIVCVISACMANAGDPPATTGKGVAQASAVDLKLLQGTWEGVQAGDQARQKITVAVTGSSLRFHRDTNFWFETTITLPAGKDPKQLHATIKDCPPGQADSIGKTVRAFFKVGDGVLTLATIGDDAEETQKGFEAAGTRYELRKVQPQEKKSESVKAPRTGKI